MVTSIRTRKIARSTVRRVKRNKLSKNVKRFLKRKVSKRKVMKGGASHFKIYLVYFTETKGLFNCPDARFPMNVLGLLFYSEINGDSFYFGYSGFGILNSTIAGIFQNDSGDFEDKYTIFTPQNVNSYDEDLGFISWLCGLTMEDPLITELINGIIKNGILGITGNTVKYCVNLNKKRVTSNLELGYCEKITNTEYVSTAADDNRTTTYTKFKIKTVGNLDPNTPIKKLVDEGEIEITINGKPCYFFLKSQTQTEIPRGVSVVNAIIAARDIMNNNLGLYADINHNLIDRYRENKYKNKPFIRTKLDSCLAQIEQSQQQPPQLQPSVASTLINNNIPNVL